MLDGEFPRPLFIDGIIEAHATGGIYPEYEEFRIEFLVERLLKGGKAAELWAPELIEYIAGEKHDPLAAAIVRVADRIDERGSRKHPVRHSVPPLPRSPPRLRVALAPAHPDG